MHEKNLPDSVMKCYQARSSDGRRKAFDSESTGFRDAHLKKTGTAERSLYGSPTLGYDSLLKPGFHIVVSVVSVGRKKFIGQI